MRDNQLLVRKCDGCGRPAGIWFANRTEHVCPRCSKVYEIEDLAQSHLEMLLEPMMQPWRQHWREKGLDDADLDAVVKSFFDKIRPAARYVHDTERRPVSE